MASYLDNSMIQVEKRHTNICKDTACKNTPPPQRMTHLYIPVERPINSTIQLNLRLQSDAGDFLVIMADLEEKNSARLRT